MRRLLQDLFKLVLLAGRENSLYGSDEDRIERIIKIQC